METDLELEDARKPTQHRPKGRGNGEGAIYKRLAKRRRRDGISFELERWCSAVTLLDGSRKVLYGRTRDEVAKKLTRALKDLQEGVAPPDQRVTVAPWLTRFIDDFEARGAAHSTVVRYRGVPRNYLAPRLGKIKLSALQPQQFQSYQSDLLKRGFAASTITIHRALLGSALKEAVTFGLIQRNIVALVKPPRENREATGRMLTPQEARRLLQVVEADRLEAFYLVLLTAGLRRGEALGLRWVDLDFDGANGPALNVRQQLQWPNGRPTLVPVKSRKGARSIPLPSITVEALRRRRELQNSEHSLVGDDNWRTEGLVFNADDGAPLHRNTITKQFHNRIKEAGIGHLRPHDLRHTYGSLLMGQGVPLKTISELMGHASIEVTADIYLHSLDIQVRDTARSVERALASPAPDSPGVCTTCGRPVPQLSRIEESTSATGSSSEDSSETC